MYPGGSDEIRIGADEAGKGPVLGSMFAAAVKAPVGALPDDVDDSKRIAPDRRTEIANVLRDYSAVEIGICEVTVDRIDDPNTDMNTIAVDAQAGALGEMNLDGHTVVVDAADTDAERFGRRLRDRLGVASVVAEHGADERHAIVGAASIVAKVERDTHVGDLADRFGALGSGYASDPTTRSFLRAYVEEHGRLPSCARRSWETSRAVLEEVEQAALEDWDGS